nr:MAG TPA: hypothetical protein [Caudoviricetes sp.]DAU41430.1 MAG TPA: hypothetical protein [Bacteriophage sp.]
MKRLLELLKQKETYRIVCLQKQQELNRQKQIILKK